MATQCYAMVRGSAIRVTGLRPCGSIPDTITYSVSKSVARVEITEVTESGANELLKTDRDNEPRLHFVRPEEPIRYRTNIQFLRVDPGLLSLVAGVPIVYGYPSESGFGFGEGPFGLTPFGIDSSSNIVGFDQSTRLPAVAFAMEVWSKLTDQQCIDGQRKYGYTLFPYLKGGYISGFTFQNGLVSFNLVGAQTRRGSRWGTGPYDLDDGARLLDEVSGNTMWRQFITTAAPPTETDGTVEFTDIIDGEFVVTSPDIVDGEFVVTSSDIIEGGYAL